MRETPIFLSRGLDQLQAKYFPDVSEPIPFHYMLGRILRDQGEDQRGLIVIAESSYRDNFELLAKKIATEGHRWGDINNLADIPYFAPAKSTRLLQLADFVANAVFVRYESGGS